MEISIEFDKQYIDHFGDTLMDEYGNYELTKGQEFAQRIRREVFDKHRYNEFRSRWRSSLKININEEVCSDFVDASTDMYFSDDLDQNEVTELIRPMQVSAAKIYAKDHAKALQNASIRYRKEQAEYLSPLIETLDNSVLDAQDVLELLINGVISLIDEDESYGRLEDIVKPLNDAILENRDKIDLDNEYFYEGPEHLGIIPTPKSKKIAQCVCWYNNSGHYSHPYLLGKEDKVNSEAIEFIGDISSPAVEI